MSASVLVPAPKVPSVDARLAEIRCLLTFVDERDVPKSVVTLIRAQLLVPVSAMTVLPSCVAGPAVNATAPVMAPVPKGTRSTAPEHFNLGDVFRIQWEIEQVVIRVRRAPTDAIHPQRGLVERAPAKAQVGLDAKRTPCPDVHPRNGLKHICDGCRCRLGHFFLANHHKGSWRLLRRQIGKTACN